MAKLRVSLSKGISGIPAPHKFVFKTSDLKIHPPKLWDEPDTLIIIGPGSLYTSIIPNLLFKEIYMEGNNE